MVLVPLAIGFNAQCIGLSNQRSLHIYFEVWLSWFAIPIGHTSGRAVR